MRVASGKGNDAKKILTYYRVNFGLRAPYRVLCDGALIHHALTNGLYLRDALPALLGASARAVVTRCVHEELRSLGEATGAAALFAKRLNRVPCTHGDTRIPAAECVLAAVRGGGAGLCVATNDGALLRGVREVPGVPVVRIVGEGKFALVPPTKATLEKVAEQELFKVGVQRPDEVKALEEEKERVVKLRAERKDARKALKRARPKGPNPLSVKKPKKPKKVHLSEGKGNEGNPSSVGARIQKESSGDGEAVQAVEASEEHEKKEATTSKPKRVRRRRPKLTPKPARANAPETTIDEKEEGGSASVKDISEASVDVPQTSEIVAVGVSKAGVETAVAVTAVVETSIKA